jgi:hypothetical protein
MTAKAIVGQALVDNAALVTLVGKDTNDNPRIYQSWHDSERKYPQITIVRVSEEGAAHGDDKTLVLSTPIQIDVWVSASYKKSPTEIELKVKEVIRALPNHQRSEIRVVSDNTDTTDKVYRITMRVTIYE